MRTFIAIELPENIKNSLAKLVEQLKTTGADVKWVQPQNIHLTLKFLGERDDKKVKQIIEMLEETAGNHKPYEIRIQALGAFPNLNSPRVIWVGLDKGDSETKNIAKDLEECICKAGIPKEKREFSSHITIGRVRSPKNKEKLFQALRQLADAPAKMSLETVVTKITLFKSTLTAKGPIYEVLKEAILKAS